MTVAPPEYDWSTKADQHREIARRALGPDRSLLALACFHAQQYAKKYLKGYMVAPHILIRFAHDLDYPIQLCTLLNVAAFSIWLYVRPGDTRRNLPAHVLAAIGSRLLLTIPSNCPTEHSEPQKMGRKLRISANGPRQVRN